METFYNTTNVINVENLDIKLHSFILLASGRNSGKSVMLRALVKYFCDNFDINNIIIFSKTSQYTNEYDFLNKKFHYDYDKTHIIDKIINYQKSKMKNKKELDNILLIFDDIYLHKKNNKLIEISSMGRHFNITCLTSVQFPKQVISTAIRNNIDYLFINELNNTGLEAIYDCINIPYTYKEFKKYVYENNNNYQFIMYSNKIKEKNKKIQIVKANYYNKLEFVA